MAQADVAVSGPWVEKYRPKTMDDIAQQDEVVSALRNSLQTGELPNLMFYGPPGTGKTSVALALVQQFYGAEWRSRVKELNASDERGINAVREQVKGFAQLAIGTTEGDLSKSKARFRVIILDEADSMTHDAQAALRRIMEEFVLQTRFIIICNYVSKIIEPLHSRCSKFRFQPINAKFQCERLQHICEAEGVRLAPGALERLVNISKGDLRASVTMLQTAVSFYGQAHVDENAFFEVACIVPVHRVTDLLKRTSVAKSTDEVLTIVKGFMLDGYSGQQIMAQLLQIVVNDPHIPDLNKARCATLFSQVEERLVQGSDEELQMFNLFSSLRPLIQR